MGPDWPPTWLGASIGMLVVETIAKIRRAYFSQGKAIKEICRELRISRKVVRKVIRTGATEFRYERSRQPMPRLGPWRERLEALLDANSAADDRVEDFLFAQSPPNLRLTSEGARNDYR